jgi:hypothetical protein
MTPVTTSEIQVALRCARASCTCGRGRTTHCPAHPDRGPSLSVREVGGRLLVHCYAGCRQTEVLEALRARGLWTTSPSAGSLPAARTSSPLAQARRGIIREARAQRWAEPGVLELYRISDYIRGRRRLADRARAAAAALPEDRAWDLLALAARAERDALNVEAALEAALV